MMIHIYIYTYVSYMYQYTNISSFILHYILLFCNISMTGFFVDFPPPPTSQMQAALHLGPKPTELMRPRPRCVTPLGDALLGPRAFCGLKSAIFVQQISTLFSNHFCFNHIKIETFEKRVVWWKLIFGFFWLPYYKKNRFVEDDHF